MREVLVAVFETESQADQAARSLQSADVPTSAIRRYHKDDPNIPHAAYMGQSTASEPGVHYQETERQETHSGGGFWSWLLGEESSSSSEWRDPAYGEEHDRLYTGSVARGNTVLAVYVDQADSDRVMNLLASQNPMTLEDTGRADTDTDTDTGTVMQHTTGRAGQYASAATTAPTGAATGAATEGTTGAERRQETAGEKTIPLAEEQVEVGKRRVEQPVQVRRYVIERPVEEQVNLRDERVEIERRTPAAGSTPGAAAFEERTVETHETREEPTVNKTAKVGEEVVVRKDASERTETVHDTARKEDVEVTRGSQTDRGSKTTD